MIAAAVWERSRYPERFLVLQNKKLFWVTDNHVKIRSQNCFMRNNDVGEIGMPISWGALLPERPHPYHLSHLNTNMPLSSPTVLAMSLDKLTL